LEQSYILMICGFVLSPNFSHFPYFQLLNIYFHHFFANASFFQQQIAHFTSSPSPQRADYQDFQTSKKFANPRSTNTRSYLLRKTAMIPLGFTATKILIFRKCHKLFAIFMLLRIIFT